MKSMTRPRKSGVGLVDVEGEVSGMEHASTWLTRKSSARPPENQSFLQGVRCHHAACLAVVCGHALSTSGFQHTTEAPTSQTRLKRRKRRSSFRPCRFKGMRT
eukprot:749124-Amphidinium_carterae.1